MLGVVIQVFLLWYFNSGVSDLELCLREGDKIQPIWDSQMIKHAILTASFILSANFVLVAVLAKIAHQHRVLLGAAAKDLGITD